MWTRIMLKPWWARALAAAGVYAIGVAAVWCAHGLAASPHQAWLSTPAGQAVSIVFVGLLVAALTSSSHNACTNALAGLDPAQRSAAIDASFRGPVPVDAPVRDAATRIAGRRLYSARSWRVMLVLIVLTACVPLARGAWPSWGPEGWLYFAVILGFTVAAWYEWLSSKHRLQTLRQPGDFD